LVVTETNKAYFVEFSNNCV